MGRYCQGNCSGNNTNFANIVATNTFLPTSNNNTCRTNEDLLDNLRNYIGCLCNCQFNTNNTRALEEQTGLLEEIGNNYLILRSTNTGRRTICNTDNLQFVNIL